MKCRVFDKNGEPKNFEWSPMNRVTLSRFREFGMENYSAPTYSIKYVIDGTEHYRIGKKNIAVSAGKFTIVNCDTPIDFQIRSSRKDVLGLCIHLRKDIVADHVSSLCKPVAALLEYPEDRDRLPHFDNLLYDDEENELGKILQQAHAHLDTSAASIDMEEDEFYMRLIPAFSRLYTGEMQSSNVLKSSTKNELRRRLEIGKELIADGMDVGIEEVAKKAMMSPAHFYRCFRQAYGLSPYQYSLQERLHKAASLLRSGKAASEVAFTCGFADLASFSKAFKKLFDNNPSSYGKKAVCK